MEYKLSDLIDIKKLHHLMELFYKASGIPVGIIDIDGTILVATGWQDICTKFHRIHPVTNKYCRESNDYIKSNLQKNRYIEYKCKNGLRDLALPIIILDKHVATLFLGQFLYEDEECDIDFFITQAKEFNFPEDEYIESLKKIPVFSEEKIENIMNYYTEFVNFIVDTGLSHLKQIEIEKALKESEKRFRYLVEVTSDCIWQINDRNEYIYVSPNTGELLGYKAEELLGKTPVDYKPEEEVKKIKDFFIPIAEAKKSFKNLENINLHKNGTELILETSGVPVFDADGVYSGYLGIARNITERKRAEKALLESEQKYKELSDFLPQTIFEADLQGNLTFANRHALQAFGYSREDLDRGLNIFQMVIPEDRERSMKSMKKILTGGGKTGYEYTALRKDCTTFPVIIYSAPVIREGNISGVRGILIDMTELKHGEEERRKLEIQLLQSQKLESLGILAGGIAHDFNNILTGILGYADLALMELSAHSSAKEFIHQIVISSRRAADLTKQMLAYSGMGKFIIKPLNLSEIIKNMSKLLEVSISKKCILTYNLSEELPFIEGDITQLQQIVMNLTINASEAIEDNNGEIIINTGTIDYRKSSFSGIMTEELKEGTCVYLEIRDTGKGMTEEIQNKIFDPFFTTKFTGRGLGLSAVMGIVKGHNGAIKISSIPEKGSTFTVLFPVSEKFEVHVIKDRIENIRNTIFVIDDEKTVISVAEAMLKKLGFNVLAENDSRKVTELFSKNKENISLVLLDMTMPYMDGQEVFEQLRAIDPYVKVILTSGYNEQSTISRFMEKDLAGFIQKPYCVEELKEIIDKVLH